MATEQEHSPFLVPNELSLRLVKNATLEIRLGFVRKVYSILSAQLLLTVVIAAPICSAGAVFVHRNQWMLFLAAAVLIMTMCSMCCCRRSLRVFPTNYLFLLVFTSAMAVLVGFTSAMYTWQSVLLAAGNTVGIFICMTIYAWNTKTDFTGAGPYLFVAMMTLMIFGIVISIMSMSGVAVAWAIMLYDLCGVLLFTFHIVYDTQLIMGCLGGHKISFSIDDYVFASLNLYLDIINLFLHILRFFGNRK